MQPAKKNTLIYLDHNASTPVEKRVEEAMRPYLLEIYGNPSSSHVFGQQGRMAVEKAREQCALMLGCHQGEIIFTSGGTESNNMAIKGVAYANRHKGKHIITSTVEHPAVMEVCKHLQKGGFEVTFVDVDERGLVDVGDIEKSIRTDTILISIMHANNEVGTIQPIESISQIAHSHDIVMHTDAAQSVGKIAVNVDSLGIDLLSIAGHKFCAPKGIGALYIRRGTPIEPLMQGAQHEFGLRAGTENVLEIVGLGEACLMVLENLDKYTHHMRLIRDKLESYITKSITWVRVNGDIHKRLPNTSSVSFEGINANQIIAACPNIALSAGAACHADQVDVSHVLRAMRVPLEFAMGTIRFSVGRHTPEQDVDTAVKDILKAVHALQKK